MRFVELLDESFRIVRRRLGVCVVLTAVFVLPVTVLGVLSTRSVVVGLDLQAIFDPDRAPEFGGILTVYLAAAAQSLALALAAGPIAHVVLADRVGGGAAERMRATTALRAVGWRGFGALGAAWVLTRLVIWPSSFVMGLGLFLAPLLVVVSPACALERLSPVAAFRRSWRLGRRRYGATLGFWLGSAVLVSLVFNAVSLPAQLIGLDTSFGAFLFSSLITIPITLVAAAVTASATALFYLDQRVKVEGLDLELRLAELDRR
jgi:hypothetical protein